MKSFIKGVTFLLILFVMTYGICILMIPYKANFKKYGMYNKAEYDILSEKEDTIDVIFVGDSLVYSSISPMVIWNEYGYTSFDTASPGQIIKDSYKNIKIAIESQHPKIIFMEADCIYRDATRPTYVQRQKDKKSNYFPIEKFHDNWKKIFSFESNDKKWINVNKGYVYITKTKPGVTDYPKMKETDKMTKIPNDNLEYFDKIVSLCKDNDVKLVLLSDPTQLSWNYSKHLTTTLLAKERGLEFIDMNIDNPAKIDWSTETKDKGNHINYKGAKKTSKYLGSYIKETKLVEDHRDDDKYKLWHEAYKKYKNNYFEYEQNAIE